MGLSHEAKRRVNKQVPSRMKSPQIARSRVEDKRITPSEKSTRSNGSKKDFALRQATFLFTCNLIEEAEYGSFTQLEPPQISLPSPLPRHDFSKQTFQLIELNPNS